MTGNFKEDVTKDDKRRKMKNLLDDASTELPEPDLKKNQKLNCSHVLNSSSQNECDVHS